MIDWQRVCLNLRTALGSLSMVHKKTGIDEQHLWRLARGEVAEPRFNSGVKLLDLHCDVCPERHKREVLCD